MGGGARLSLAVGAGVVALAAVMVAGRLLVVPQPEPAPAVPAEREPLRDDPWRPAPPSPAAAGPAMERAPAAGATRQSPPPPDAVTRDVVMAAVRGQPEAVARLARAIQAGDPRAYAYSALYCVAGTGCDPAPGERHVALAASAVRAGLAVRSGDPEAVYHAGLAIANAALGRSPLRGAAWMLVACRGGYDCAAPAELDRSWPCAAGDAACRAATTVEDRLQAALGAGAYAQAFTLADEFGAMLDAGDVPESAVAYGSK